MSSIHIDSDDWPDIVVSYLLDKMMNPDEVSPDNKEFNKIINKMKNSGMKPSLLHMYLNSESVIRGKYKIISSVFNDEHQTTSRITISNNQSIKDIDDKNKKVSIKNIVKKALKLIKSHKKKYGNLITEKTVDKLVDKILEEY